MTDPPRRHRSLPSIAHQTHEDRFCATSVAQEGHRWPDTIYGAVQAHLTMGEKGAEYLRSRALDPDGCATYGVRSVDARSAWDELRCMLVDTFTDDELAFAGLSITRLPWRGSVPALMLPYVVGGRVLALRWRSLDPATPKENRFRSLTGGPRILAPFNADALQDVAGQTVTVTEGEVDSLTLHLCHAVRAVGVPGVGASKELLTRTARALAPAARVVGWYDNDERGEAGFQRFRAVLDDVNGPAWTAAHVVRRRVPGAKDAAEAHQKGLLK